MQILKVRGPLAGFWVVGLDGHSFRGGRFRSNIGKGHGIELALTWHRHWEIWLCR